MSLVSLLARTFPPPRFLLMEPVGVSCSDTTLRYIKLNNRTATTGEYMLEKWGYYALPHGTIQNGVVHDATALSVVLGCVKRETNCSFVRLALPDMHGHLFGYALSPDASPAQTRGHIENMLEMHAPFVPGEVAYRYAVSKEAVEDKRYACISAYNKAVLEGYRDACRRAGMSIHALEPKASATARAVLPFGACHTSLILNSAEAYISCSVATGGTVRYTTVVSSAVPSLDEALRVAVGDISDRALREMKNENGLVQTSPPHARCVMMRFADALGTAANDTIDYWRTRTSNNEHQQVACIVLCGGNTNIRGLPEMLGKHTGLPVRRASIWQNAFSTRRYVPELARAQSYSFASAVGVALGGSEHPFHVLNHAPQTALRHVAHQYLMRAAVAWVMLAGIATAAALLLSILLVV